MWVQTVRVWRPQQWRGLPSVVIRCDPVGSADTGLTHFLTMCRCRGPHTSTSDHQTSRGCGRASQVASQVACQAWRPSSSWAGVHLGGTLSAATASSSSSPSSGTTANTCWDLAPEWHSFMPHQRSSARSANSHVPRAEVHLACQHVAPDFSRQLGHKQRLEEDDVLLPGGQ